MGTDKYLLLSQGRARPQGRICPPSRVKATGVCHLLLWYAETSRKGEAVKSEGDLGVGGVGGTAPAVKKTKKQNKREAAKRQEREGESRGTGVLSICHVRKYDKCCDGGVYNEIIESTSIHLQD